MVSLKSSKYVFKSAFSSKYITAMINDELNNVYVVPIKKQHVIEGMFFVNLGKRYYGFKIDTSKIKSSRYFGTEPVQILYYATNSILPINPNDIAELDKFQAKNPSITSLGAKQALLLQMCNDMAARKKSAGDNFEHISLSEVIDNALQGLDEKSSVYAEKRAELLNAAYDLGTDKIAMPIEPVVKILNETLIANTLSFTAIINAFRSVYFEWKKIANPAKTPFQHWMLVFGIFGFLGVIGVVGYVYYDQQDGVSGTSVFDQIKEAAESGLSVDEFIESGGGIGDTDDIFDSVTGLSDDLLGIGREDDNSTDDTPAAIPQQESVEQDPEPEQAEPEPAIEDPEPAAAIEDPEPEQDPEPAKAEVVIDPVFPFWPEDFQTHAEYVEYHKQNYKIVVEQITTELYNHNQKLPQSERIKNCAVKYPDFNLETDESIEEFAEYVDYFDRDPAVAQELAKRIAECDQKVFYFGKERERAN